MGRPRIRHGSSGRIDKRQKTRRDSTAHRSSQSDSEYARPFTPESQSLSSDDVDQFHAVQHWDLSPFELNGSGFNASSSTSSATPAWTPQPNEPDQVQLNRTCQPNISALSYSFDSSSIVDQLQLADLLTIEDISSAAQGGECVRRSEAQLPTESSLDQAELLNSEGETSTNTQLPQILFKLRTTSQALKSRPSSEAEKDQIIEVVSSLCDIIRSSNTCWSISSRLPSLDLIILATTVSVAVEIYSLLADELSSAYSSWLDHERPRTHNFLRFHANAFAMNFHLAELKEALNMAGVAAYDSHTIQLTDHVHTTVKDLLRKWQTY